MSIGGFFAEEIHAKDNRATPEGLESEPFSSASFTMRCFAGTLALSVNSDQRIPLSLISGEDSFFESSLGSGSGPAEGSRMLPDILRADSLIEI